jgi:hypothetical protein
MAFYTEEIDAIFRRAIVDRLQCGWTSAEYLAQQGYIGDNVYLWCVAGSGRLTLVEKVAEYPDVPGAVVYRELRRGVVH